MRGAAIFIETKDAGKEDELRVCLRIGQLLRSKGFAIGGPVSSLAELGVLLNQLQLQRVTPAIFVVNTFGARHILPQLDHYLGERPVLYLRRQLFAGQSGLLEQIQLGEQDGLKTSVILQKSTLRLTSIWSYGSKSSNLVAQRAADALTRYLDGADFREIEKANPVAVPISSATASKPNAPGRTFIRFRNKESTTF